MPHSLPVFFHGIDIYLIIIRNGSLAPSVLFMQADKKSGTRFTDAIGNFKRGF
jgi:hypothetical protein